MLERFCRIFLPAACASLIAGCSSARAECNIATLPVLPEVTVTDAVTHAPLCSATFTLNNPDGGSPVPIHQGFEETDAGCIGQLAIEGAPELGPTVSITIASPGYVSATVTDVPLGYTGCESAPTPTQVEVALEPAAP